MSVDGDTLANEAARKEQLRPSPDDCTHATTFATYSTVTVQHADTDGRIIGFTVLFSVECVDCKQRFYFGRTPRFREGRTEVELSCAPGRAPLEAPWVPGTFECSQCMFRNQIQTLSATTGNISPDRKAEPEPCPNECGGTMRRVTWQQAANEMGNWAMELVARVLQLEDAWPTGYEMPLQEEE